MAVVYDSLIHTNGSSRSNIVSVVWPSSYMSIVCYSTGCLVILNLFISGEVNGVKCGVG